MYFKLHRGDKYLTIEVNKSLCLDGMLNLSLQWGKELHSKYHYTGVELRSGTLWSLNPKLDARLLGEGKVREFLDAAPFGHGGVS